MRSLLMLVAGTALLAGCPKKTNTVKTNPTPEWYDEPPAGCGVGSALYQPGLREMAKTEADGNARNDLSRQLQTEVEGMVKAYMSQGIAEGETFGESMSTNVVRTITDNTLMGGRTVKNVTIGQEMFVLVCLDPETFGDMFDRMDTMSEQMREALKQRMTEEFSDLDAQIERIRAE